MKENYNLDEVVIVVSGQEKPDEFAYSSMPYFFVSCRMEYKASLGRSAKIITLVTTVVFVFTIVFNLEKVSSEDGKYLTLIISGLLVATYAFCYLYRPLSYVVEEEALIVKRPINNLRLPLSNIKSASVASKESMGWVMRTFGNGGLFGFTGKFYNSKFGAMTWYVTRRDHYLIVETKDEKTLVLTPDDVSMEQAIHQQLLNKD